MTTTNSDSASEKLLVSSILNHLAYLLMAESPNKSAVKKQGEVYRGRLLASLDPTTKGAFLKTRDIMVQLARTLAACTDRQQLGRTYDYIEQLGKGGVFVVQEPADAQTIERLARHMDQEHNLTLAESELREIIYIVHNLYRPHEAPQVD
ncbi:hypothetical protein F5984_20005 [Rudanella paleaurantiibacter]|uniref:Uncharacterized protein n=1 Tax=Rudanella paleaurantiibacter TaxID=2614655 RepID=A0A7J5TV52_9BACT|nr:hypothetical protein [Rudanella paleaurantiibacter]KAB7728040.1 hypothetical protein F5984_20005 [Rudanella paleaurantiibacter]